MNFKRLLSRNKEQEPKTVEDAYGELVEKEFRKKYSQSRVEATVNNYLLDPTNEEYKADMDEMQAYRAECKKMHKPE